VESQEKHGHPHARGISAAARVALLGVAWLAWGGAFVIARDVSPKDLTFETRSADLADILPWALFAVLAIAGGVAVVLALSGLRKRRQPAHRERGNVDAAAAVARATGREGSRPVAQSWPRR
jgi:hypothetical protein